MATSGGSRPVNVAIAALCGCPSIHTAALMDALLKTDRAWRLFGDANPEPVFDVRMVGFRQGPVECRDGVVINPHAVATQINTPDLVIVPGLDDDFLASFELNREWVPWIARWYAAGARIASSCTGAFLVADSGVLDGKEATTHWIAADEFRRRFPRVTVSPERIIVDAGDVITSGGATTFLTLVIYLAERYGGHNRAVLASKVMLVDGDRRSHLPYVAFGPYRDHGDDLIHAAQNLIEKDPGIDFGVDALAAQMGVSARTLDRRFKTAIGESPRAYVQRARIGAAKRLLETTAEPVDHIRGRIGYQDPAAFRRLFKRRTGLSPADYRRKYGPLKRSTPS